jgi:dephospho-CoA kinase
MKKIAITGGIGTGKTYISRFFVQMGIPVFYADEEAKKCYGMPEVIEALRTQLGEEVFTDGQLDLKKMAACVFQYPEKRAQVNGLIHPKVMELFEAWAAQQGTASVMMETAVLFENGLERYFDMVVVVDAPMEVRIARIKKRNPNLSEQEIKERINAQMPQEEKCQRADMVIRN